MNKFSHKVLYVIFLILLNGTFSLAQRVPEWTKSAIWYQIFPERFNNADINNDPTIKDMIEAWPYVFPKDVQTHPWTSDWYKLQPWEEHTGKDFYSNVNIRRYGGDIQGIIEKLDYLTELGINAIYLNPIFESPSLHKYDATMYHHVDNNFGPTPNGDRNIWREENPNDPQTWQWTSADSLFLVLINKCHEKSIKIIIDGVFNHVGTSFWAFKDVVKNQVKSKYKDWFIINSWDNPETKINEFEYAGWYGIKDLPEFREDKNGLVKGPRQHIFTIVKRWMDPNNDGDPSDGIDGWRLDVAEMVNINFWKDFRHFVKQINPNAYLTGEIWWDDWKKNKMMNAAPWLEGDTFDAIMNYRFTRAVKNFISNIDSQIVVSGFIDSINAYQNDYPLENQYALMNLLGSHDTERLASLTVNPDNWYDHNGTPSQNKNFSVRKPNRIERLKQKLMVGIQMTMPGAPMIYYGDEVGMWGGDDPDCRKPMVWAELKYEDETKHPYGLKRPIDKVEFDSTLFNWNRKLISIRKSNFELSIGDLNYFLINDTNKILGYTRTLDKDTSFILINNSNIKKEVHFRSKKNELISLLDGKKYMKSKFNFAIKLQPYEIVILK